MNEYDIIAPFYDIEHARFNEDLDMYRNFAELSGGTILELASGSGRVLLPLARAGYTITGVDSSANMLEIARQQVQAEGLFPRVTLVQQDIAHLQLGRKFRMAFIALGSFAHLVTRTQQQETLAAIRLHMSKGGTFIIDISNADAHYLEDLGGHVLHQGTWKRDDGSFLTHFISPAAATDQHMLELTHFYEQHTQAGPVLRTVVTTHLYLFERGEMELLLEQAGFTIIDIFGDHDLGPFQLDSPRMICIAEAK